MRYMTWGIALLALTGCGVSETAVTAAAGAAAKSQEIEAAQRTQERVESQLEAASQAAQQRMQQSEAAAN